MSLFVLITPTNHGKQMSIFTGEAGKTLNKTVPLQKCNDFLDFLAHPLAYSQVLLYTCLTHDYYALTMWNSTRC